MWICLETKIIIWRKGATKIDKITEELFTALIRRIERLEEKVGQTQNNAPQSIGMATKGQLDYIKGLGGEIRLDMTKTEAGECIEELLKKKKQTEPEYIKSKPLTQEQIDEIGEENLF